jgi:hypothetical protein
MFSIYYNNKMDKVSSVAKEVSGVYLNWLRAEVASSHVERNKILDEYDDAVEGLRGGWEHPKNFTARKAESHTDRLAPWYEAFSLVPDDDYQASRIIFAGLMQLSGNYRNQCYVEATDSEDYLNRRSLGVGIDLAQSAKERMRIYLPESAEFDKTQLSIESLDARRQEVERIGMSSVRTIVSRVKGGYDLGLPDSTSVREAKIAQYTWAGFTTDALTLVAKLRGGSLEAVPFLEPRSITDQSGTIYYPFHEPVDWTEALAA